MGVSLSSEDSIQRCSTMAGEEELTSLGGGEGLFVCARGLRVLHNERSAAGMFGTLVVPALCTLLLQVDVAGGGVVGEGLQNRPVAPEVHQT